MHKKAGVGIQITKMQIRRTGEFTLLENENIKIEIVMILMVKTIVENPIQIESKGIRFGTQSQVIMVKMENIKTGRILNSRSKKTSAIYLTI